MKSKLPLLSPFALLAFLSLGCNDSVTEPPPFTAAHADTTLNLFTNKPATATDATPYTYFSMRTKAEVVDTSLGWDIALRTTTIKFNGQSQLLSATDFDTLSQAPATGYSDGASSLSWYDYSGEPNHTITPKLATVIAVQTVDGKYAKFQILSYYKNAPTVPNGLTDTSRYYKFRYFLQADGTKVLK